nr:MAG TPA: hypothetical protein [Caudoviricetes sp.]
MSRRTCLYRTMKLGRRTSHLSGCNRAYTVV